MQSHDFLSNSIKIMASAPFTDEQFANIQRWQNCGILRPLFCPEDHSDLIPKLNGIYCGKCNYTQKDVALYIAEFDELAEQAVRATLERIKPRE